MITFECDYGDVHTFPDDWKFGGADGTDPRSDARWQPTTYRYLDANLEDVWMTQVPLCDDQALDEFTWVTSSARAVDPVYLMVRRPGESDLTLMDWTYNKATDILSPLAESSNG